MARPVVLVDGHGLGVRHAREGLAKVGSVEWGERGFTAVEWYAYSKGYDFENGATL